MKRFARYLKTDLYRSVCSPRFALAVILTAGVLLLATREGIALDTDVLYVFSLVMYGMPAMVILVCGAIVFAGSLCEDLEHRYLTQQVIRGSLKSYVTARTLSIFLATALAAALGIFLFAEILHLRLPWADPSGPQYDHMLRAGGLRFFLARGLYPLYYLCYGLQYGVLVGVLALWAACLSVYVPNRMLVLSSPMIFYYFADYALVAFSCGNLSLNLLFSPADALFPNEFPSVLAALGLAALNLCLTGAILFASIRRRGNG